MHMNASISRLGGRSWKGGAIAGMLVAAGVLIRPGSHAAADPVGPQCTSNAGITTCTFLSFPLSQGDGDQDTPTEQRFLVPPNVHRIQVEAIGGAGDQGGAYYSCP